MNKLGLVFGLVLCGLGGGVAAQQKGAEALQQAILREESERDDAAAARMYRAVAEDAAADPEVRVQAFERLVRLSRRTGAYEREKVELERLAAQIGEPARAALARVGSQTEELEEHARRLVDGWQQHNSPPELEKTLVLIGQPAVPALAAEAEELGVGRNQWPIMVIGKIGGEGADVFLERVAQSPDVLYRRGVLGVISELHHDTQASLRPFLKQFLRDPDEQVRFSAVSLLRGWLELPEQLPLLLDPSERINGADCLNWQHASTDASEAALRQLTQMRDSVDANMQRAVVRQVGCLVRSGILPDSKRLSEFVLQCLPMLETHNSWAIRHVGWPGPVQYGIAALPDDEVRAIAERLGPIATDRRDQSIAVGILANLVAESLDEWRAESIPTVLHLAELGYDRVSAKGRTSILSRWLANQANREHAASLAASLDNLSWPLGVVRRLNDVGWGETDATPLLSMLGTELSSDEQLRGALVEAVLSIGSELGDRGLVEAAMRDSRILQAASAAVWSHRIEGRPRLLGPLLTATPDGAVSIWRDWVFKRIAEEGNPELVESLPRAYALGLPRDESEHFYHGPGSADGEKVRGVPGIGHLVASGRDGQRFSAYDATTVALVFELCAATDAQVFWAHAVGCIGSAPIVGQPLVSWYARHVARFARITPGVCAAVVSMVLKSSTLETEREEVLAWTFEDGPSQAMTAALRELNSLTKSKEKYVRAALQSEDFETVQWAIRLLVHERRDASLYGWLSELARHRSSIVRETLTQQIVSVPDRRWIPILLELLRDPSDHVREAAQGSLQKMQFYFDTVERWERWQKGTNLDSPNAAEALLAQASPDQPKPKRLAAITSLGTLGVPETLPLLIEWMNDSDPDIAKAASDAVTRINERKR